MKPQWIIILCAAGLTIVIFILRRYLRKPPPPPTVKDLIYVHFLSIHENTNRAQRGDKLTEYFRELETNGEEMSQVPDDLKDDVLDYARGVWNHFLYER